MTSLQRCLAVLNNEIPDHVPVVPQAFLFACETAGLSMADANRDPARMARAHIISQETYGYDGCVIDFDDASLAEACGAKVIYRDNEPAVVDENEPLLKSVRAVHDLSLPEPASSPRLQHWLETTSILSDSIGDHVFIMGRADQGPFSLACLLRGIDNFMMDLMTEDPEAVHALIDYCRKACALFAKAQKDAGAHATSIGDALAGPGLISPDMYRMYALGPEQRLTTEVQSYGIPFSIHICGDTNSILQDLAATHARILEVDSQVDLAALRQHCGSKTVIMGNINPAELLVFGTPLDVDRASEKIVRELNGRNLFLSSGCAMGRNTKPENMSAMVRAAHTYGTLEQILEMNHDADLQ
jgi:uroporphyrinogen decarboxylase